MKKIILIVISIILLANLLPLHIFLDEGHYRYSNADGSFTGIDIKSRKYNLSPVVPDSYRKEHPNSTDTLVYRVFWKNPLAFWRWRTYFTDKRYKLPYKSWEEIKKKRGYDIEYSNKWQDF